MKGKSWIAVLFLLTLAVMPVSSAPKGDDETIITRSDTSDVLKGLPGVYVLVEALSSDAQDDGLKEDDIRTDAELRLRGLGITVFTKEEALKTPGGPALIVQVSARKNKSNGLYNLSLSVELQENAILERTIDSDGSKKRIMVIGAITWRKGSVGSVGARHLHDDVRDAMKDMIDQFCNDYLKANPKK